LEAYFASAGVFASATGAGAFVSVAVVEEQPTTENANTASATREMSFFIILYTNKNQIVFQIYS
jgi:hypothetical protein